MHEPYLENEEAAVGPAARITEADYTNQIRAQDISQEIESALKRMAVAGLASTKQMDDVYTYLRERSQGTRREQRRFPSETQLGKAWGCSRDKAHRIVTSICVGLQEYLRPVRANL
jgi:hypothetical protein